MAIDAPTVSARSAAGAGKIRPLSLADIDRRTAAYQSAKRLLGELINDLGGEAIASAAQRELAQRAAVMGALIEDVESRFLRGEAIALGDYLASVNAQRRVLATIGLERHAATDRTPTLDGYLARQAAA